MKYLTKVNEYLTKKEPELIKKSFNLLEEAFEEDYFKNKPSNYWLKLHCINNGIFMGIMINMLVNKKPEIFKNSPNINFNLDRLILGGLKHDIGKNYLPNPHYLDTNISQKQKKEIEMHPVLGYEKIKEDHYFQTHHFREMREIIQKHHEKPNGTGYPFHEIGPIPIYRELAHLADFYDTRTSKRPYFEGAGITILNDYEAKSLIVTVAGPFFSHLSMEIFNKAPLKKNKIISESKLTYYSIPQYQTL